MKKIISLLVILTLLLSAGNALAEGMDVQIIGIPELTAETVTLDDLQLETEVDIDGYGIVLAKSFEFTNYILSYKEGNKSDVIYNSGNDAEYALLRLDITNTAFKEKDFLAECEVKAVFDDSYEYVGWAYQQNYDNPTWTNAQGEVYKPYKGKQNLLYAVDKADNFPIEPMYTGHYMFGCTLPNAIVDSKAPLRLVITIDGNEITYNIRK